MDLRKELIDLPESSMVLVVSPSKEIIKTNMEILRIITESGGLGLYITLNHPYETLKNLLEQNDIDPNRFFFIDCITKTVDGKAKRVDNCLFIASPRSLAELEVAFTQAIQAIPGDNKFIFMDSLSTLLIYNSTGTTAKFSHFLITKIRLSGLKGIFMSIDADLDKHVLSKIEQLCDKCIHVV